MARFPGAIWKPITASKGRRALTVHNRVNLHVAVSEASSLHGFFNQSGIADSHFYVRRDGVVEQYVDTSMNAFADLEGNDATISVETQGFGGGEWTTAQLEFLACIFAWAAETHGIPVRLASSSKTDSTSRGLSWHRLGIDGNFPALPSILAGRLQRGGGMHYSQSTGKECPGSQRIPQIPGILARAQELLGAPTIEPEGFLMALSDSKQDAVYEAVTDKVQDGDEWRTQADAERVGLKILRRIEARIIANEAAPVDVDVDAAAVADALVERLSKPVAQAVADVLAARLAT
jgi:hypothetical protein